MDLPNAEIKLGFPALQADSLSAKLPGKPQCPQKSLPKKLKKLKNYLIIINYVGNNQLTSYLNSINIPHTSCILVSKRGKKWYPFQGYDPIDKCLLKVHYMFMYNHISVYYNNISYSFLNNSVIFINSVSVCYYMGKFLWVNKAIYPYAKLASNYYPLWSLISIYAFTIFCLYPHGYLKYPTIMYLNLTVLLSFLTYYETENVEHMTKMKNFKSLKKVWTLVLVIYNISVFIYIEASGVNNNLFWMNRITGQRSDYPKLLKLQCWS